MAENSHKTVDIADLIWYNKSNSYDLKKVVHCDIFYHAQKGMIFQMKTLTEYGQFREHCLAFKEEFAEEYLPEGQLLCHPLIKGLIFAPASEEEVKSNSTNICRLYDLMLMSENGTNDWKPFNIAEARKIASENEHIFLSDLMFGTLYCAHDWMIDGKHDQLIVSEQYMREHNKPYAPVTPLTNQRLNIKKINDESFWVKGTLENPAFITFNEISENLDKFSADRLSEFPVISEIREKTFKIADTEVKIPADSAKYMTLVSSLRAVDRLKSEMDGVSPILSALGMKMTAAGYSIKFLVAALNKNGVSINGADFRNSFYEAELKNFPENPSVTEELAAAGKAFIKAFAEKNTIGFKIPSYDEKKSEDALTEAESGNLSGKELLSAVLGILSEKPANGAPFKLLYANFPDSVNEIAELEEFWLSKKRTFSDEELNAYLEKKYVPADSFDDKGEYCCGSEKARLICEELSAAASKYRFPSCPAVAKIKAYIDKEEINARTYNGTVFDSAEDMKKAAENESKIADLCTDLSALDRNEIAALKKYIFDSTADKKTKAKYLVKIKLAENDVQKNELSQIALKLPLSSLDEAKAILEKLKAADADDAVKKEFIVRANDRIISAQAEELSAKFKSIDSMKADEIDAVLKECDTDRYSPIVKKHFVRKASYAKNNLSRRELDDICKDMDKLDRVKLGDLRKTIEEKKYPSSISGSYLRKIASLAADFDRKEVVSIFGGVSKASREELEKLRAVINEGRYSTELTDPYINKIAERERAIKIEEFEERCKKISEMDKDSLAKIKAEFTGGEYPEEITSKYADKIIARENALENAEIDEIVRDMDKADIPTLENMKKALSDEKFKKEHTAPFFVKLTERKLAVLTEGLDKMNNADLDKLTQSLKSGEFDKEKTSTFFDRIKTRRETIEKDEIAALCKDIPSMDREALKKLQTSLSDEKYNKEFTAPYFDKIKHRNIEIDNAEVVKICENVDKMDRAALKTAKEKISDEKYDKEFTDSYFDKIKAREAELDKAELTELTKDVEKLNKSDLEKLTAKIKEKYSKDIISPFIEKIRAKEISLMKAEMEQLCKNIPSTPRSELSKLKDALKGGEFDKELSEKYIKQIEERENSLIKTELSDLCRNLDNAPKEKLHEMKQKISELPEYAEPGKEYVSRIDARLRKLDKEEFDKMMNSIDKMSREEIDKFSEELQKRKPTLDMNRYSAAVKSADKRIDELDKAELDELCKNMPAMTISEITAALHTIEDKGFKPANSAAYIKRLNGAAEQLHIKELSKLTEKLDGLTKSELLEICGKIADYKNGCTDDLKKRYDGIVRRKIREVEDKEVGILCRGIGSMTESEICGLIEKIKLMDIDDEAKKRHVSNCENTIISKKTETRDLLTSRIGSCMSEHSLNQSVIVTRESPTFDSTALKMEHSFADIGKFDLPVILHTVTQGNPDEGFIITLEYLYCRNRNGLITKKALGDISRFMGKNGIFSANTLKAEEKNGSTTELPSSIKGKFVENVAIVLSDYLEGINAIKAAEHKKMLERNAAENDSFMNIQASEASKPANAASAKPTEVPKPNVPAAKPVEVPTSAAPAAKPVEVPASAAPAAKPVEVPASAAPAAKPVEVPASAAPAAKPVDVPDMDIKPIKPIETSETPKIGAGVDIKPIKPIEKTETPKVDTGVDIKPIKPIEKTETAKPAAPASGNQPIKIRFCDQCGAKITSSTAKFCSECGNKIG